MKRTTKQQESSTATSDEYPQTGGPISREAWLGVWPISKRGNEWVRAFDATYTLKNYVPFQHEGGLVVPGVQLTVVGPGGVRIDRTYEGNERDVKERLWPEGRDCPFLLADFVDGVMA